MKQQADVPEFDRELQQLLEDGAATNPLINRLGNNLAHETNLLFALKDQVEANRDARFQLMQALSEPQRLPLSQTRRERLESRIAENLPKYLHTQQGHQPAAHAQRPAYSSATPPPIPGAQDQPRREMHASQWNFRDRMEAAGG